MRKKKIHIVYIITKLQLGGAQKVCLSLFHGLKKKDTEMSTTLITGSKGILVKTIKNSSDVILLDSIIREVSFGQIYKEIKSFFQLRKQLKQLKQKYPHLIVHTHSTKAGIIGRWAAWAARIPIRVHTVHGYGFHSHQPKYQWFAVYSLELITSFITTHFVCVSSEDVKIGIKLFPFFTKKHSIIRAAVEWNQFHIPQIKINKSPFIFGTVACFKPQKNIFDLLKAFEQQYQTKPNTQLELIGDGLLRPHIEQWIQEHHLAQKIVLHGWQHNVASIMKKWNAFVLTSLWEGLPCAIVEARLLRLPIVCYDTGGISDIIDHNENGLLYAPGNWQGVAQGMKKVQERKLYNKFQLHQENLLDFKQENMIKQHKTLYMELVK